MSTTTFNNNNNNTNYTTPTRTININRPNNIITNQTNNNNNNAKSQAHSPIIQVLRDKVKSIKVVRKSGSFKNVVDDDPMNGCFGWTIQFGDEEDMTENKIELEEEKICNYCKNKRSWEEFRYFIPFLDDDPEAVNPNIIDNKSSNRLFQRMGSIFTRALSQYGSSTRQQSEMDNNNNTILSSNNNPRLVPKHTFVADTCRVCETEQGYLPRLVPISVNIISLNSVDDKNHLFRVNFLVTIRYDPTPLRPELKFFRPWLQFNNIDTLDEIQNDGMKSHSNKELIKLVEAGVKNVLDVYNFVGVFASELNFKYYPFDRQILRIRIVSNPISEITLTHAVYRDEKTKYDDVHSKYKDGKRPSFENKERTVVMRSIKSNMENDLLSEWDAVLLPQRKGEPVRAAVQYVFEQHARNLSSQGFTYQHLDIILSVKRDSTNMIWTVLVPTIALSVSSLCIFRLNFEDFTGDRYQIIFTIILTLVANSFVTKDKLPSVAYVSLIEKFILYLQLGVYFTLLATITTQPMADYFGYPDYSKVNIDWCIACSAYFIVVLLYYGHRLARIYLGRIIIIQRHIKRSQNSWNHENERLKALGYGKTLNVVSEQELAEAANEAAVSMSGNNSRSGGGRDHVGNNNNNAGNNNVVVGGGEIIRDMSLLSTQSPSLLLNNTTYNNNNAQQQPSAPVLAGYDSGKVPNEQVNLVVAVVQNSISDVLSPVSVVGNDDDIGKRSNRQILAATSSEYDSSLPKTPGRVDTSSPRVEGLNLVGNDSGTVVGNNNSMDAIKVNDGTAASEGVTVITTTATVNAPVTTTTNISPVGEEDSGEITKNSIDNNNNVGV
jgi:hypothetical protein